MASKPLANGRTARPDAPATRRPRLAALVNEYWSGSHADLIVTKLFDGYQVMWTPIAPHTDVDSLYIHDPGPTDVGEQRAESRGVRMATSVGQALCGGGDELAVEGVVIVPERNVKSGRPVPLDQRGRHIDPRHELFTQARAVIEKSRRPIPLFIDKYLGTTWEQIKDVYDVARRLGIPLMAGSSVPFTLRPATQVPFGAKVEEVVVAASGLGEAPIFHTIELVQSMIERRAGGETGVASVEYLAGEEFWSAWRAGDRWSMPLFESAVAQVPHATESVAEYYSRRPERASAVHAASGPTIPAAAAEAVIVHFLDGVQLTLLLLTGYMLRRAVAMRLSHTDAPLVTWTPTGVKLTSEPLGATKASAPDEAKPATWNFDHFAFFIDEFMLTGVPPFPVERTVLSSGILDAAMTSRHLGRLVETPHLAIEYQARRLPGSR